MDRDQGSPRMAEHSDLLFVKFTAEISRWFDAVFGDAIECDIRGLLAVTAVGVACSALVPLHNRERPFPRFENIRGWPLCLPGSALHSQQHGLGGVITANANPLLQAAEWDE